MLPKHQKHKERVPSEYSFGNAAMRRHESRGPTDGLTVAESGFRPSRRGFVAGLSLSALAGCLASRAAVAQAPRRILHVDSYHVGNQWNDRIAAALVAALKDHGISVRVFHLDAKRKSSEDERRESARAAKRAIEEFDPHAVTISDDDAAKYLLMPYYRDAAIPFVFCGLNWDASVYGLPYSNTTGMVEVSPIPQILRFLRQHARGLRIGFLSEDTETKRKELLHHERLFGIKYDKAYFVGSFEAWKNAFREAQSEVDMLLVLGVGAIADWDVGAAAKFAEEVSEIPTGTDFEWLMPVVLLGVTKSPEEQGRWAAQAAIRILDGVPPRQIPLTYNREGELMFNSRIARRLGVAGPPPLARKLP
jgi:hypothetical protein